MLNSRQNQDGGKDSSASNGYAAAPPPAISLPKGGGAIRGIGEKFAANPVTGTGSITVPIATSPGRSGFGPQLLLSYDSGAGNGLFGFGWSLSLPAITRKTDKGLPQYRDAEESDVFILSGAEDLVPVLKQDNQGRWEPEVVPPRTVDGVTYTIRRYRPRIEGLFARIERWTDRETGETHWRSISKDNITTLYGKTNNSRFFDPNDTNPQHPTRIFSWLLCSSYDDKGNTIVYEYAAENDDNVDGAQANERNRVRTANRYLKRIKYGNRTPNRDATTWEATDPAQLPDDTWMFEVVFDYGEGHYAEDAPDAQGRVFARAHIDPPAGSHWPVRQDPFSTYRAGFEVRTYRLCRRVLMLHHFPQELGINDCLVRSTEFSYSESPIASFISSVTQLGYVRQPIQNQPNRYLKKSLPPLEFEYSQVPSPEELAQQPIREVDAESLENLPVGLDSTNYQWMDLDGEGTSGILTEQADAWYYKRNLSANNLVREDGHERTVVHFGPMELVASKPAFGLAGGGQFLDLAGDGQVDLVQMDGPVRGFYERTDDTGWAPFRAFISWPNVDTRDPNLKFADLTGDGHADILLTEEQALTWHASLVEDGFGSAIRLSLPLDEERGPRLVFDDGTQSIYLSDMSGDGLTDLVRIRNGEVCYWPNLGYGRFGAKVTMDNAPRFDYPDHFDQRRIRLADIDGSGTTDIIYLGAKQVDIYRNQAGNGWSSTDPLMTFPHTDNLSSIQAVDLLGNGTACLVWSSPLRGAARRPMRYIDLMGGQKPHLLVKTINNLGAETHVHYAPSTKFYLNDKAAGKPWITKLPFPVHVVERVETFDAVSRNRFVTRYAYHHGYFDGIEREFRGFGLVEQWDTEEFAALSASDDLATGDNIDAASHVPPMHTKTWFHTGVYVGRDHISNFFAGLIDAHDRGEYYREPAWRDDVEARKRLLADTVLPEGLSVNEEREACRALKGAMLRQEVYALDGTDKAQHPYMVTEQNFTIERLQPQARNRHGVFFTHAREAISYHYERNPADPRISHALTLEVDAFGNVLKSVAIGYGRRLPDPNLSLQADRDKQTQTLVTYTENRFTNPITEDDAYRTPLPCETCTYELTGYPSTVAAGRFQISDFVQPDTNDAKRLIHIFDSEIDYEATRTNGKQRRPIEHIRTLYRKNDLTDLLPLGKVESLALPGESYKLAFTPGLLAQVYQRPRTGQPPENLLPIPANVLGGQGADRGGYLVSQGLKATGAFPNTDPDDHWWLPAGRVFLSANTGHNAAQELTHARQHFFLPQRYRDPFGQTAVVTYDAYDLLMVETRDPLGNRVTVGERDAAGNIVPNKPGNDYRVLQPRSVTDPNRNRVEVAFDTLGMVAGTAVKGKDDTVGDMLNGFEPDLTQAQVDGFYNVADPHVPAPSLLKGATTRIVYDIDSFRRTRQAHPEDSTQWLPVYAATLARETHVSDLQPNEASKLQVSFSYSDGFGREIQKKIQAEPGPLVEGGPVVSPRWVGSGWTIFNNKGKPVRQYEPFFSQLPEKRHRFEFGVQVGVSPILFYDPVERVVATLHPNHTYEKVVFDPWRQITYDVNDTVAANGTETGDPRTDVDIRGYVAEYFKTQPNTWQTWHQQRISGAKGAQETSAAEKAAKHANTPTTAHFDTLGRPFLTLAHNGFEADGTPIQFPTRVKLDIEGNQREVRDAIEQNGDKLGRIVMRYDYDMLGNRIHQASMEAGERWMLNDVTGKPIRAWDSRGHAFRTEYDPLRRPLRSFVTGAGPANPNQELLTERLVYGEQHPQDELRNLRGVLYLHLDQAGVVTNEAHDFKGNPLRATRRLAREYKQSINWSTVNAVLPANATANLNPAALEAALAPRLEADTFTSRTAYDALSRPVQLIAPRSGQPGAKRNVIQPVYNEANLLERVHVWLGHPSEPAGLLDAGTLPPSPVGVSNIDYDAKGQRLRIEYKNGVTTRYAYDPVTFRLIHLYTRRGAAFTQDCGGVPPPPRFATPDVPPQGTPCGLQNLYYTYDPIGNITYIRDDAQQTIYFAGQVVPPHCDYTYDAIYRLIMATGREHIGQVGQPETTWNDEFRVRLPHPGDGQAMRNYTEAYEYDAVGNFEKLIHQAANGNWTRTYAYKEASLIESATLAQSAKQSNRLSSTTIGNGVSEPYTYDVHGNMTRMNHLPLMQWDYRDQLQATARQVINNGVPETTWYAYDAGGQRVRKVTESAVTAQETASGKKPKRTKERIYLGDFEIYREYENDGVTIKLARETLHIVDDKQRIALVETRIQGNEPGVSAQLIRYQFGNHLGSASLELDSQAQIISYEEYTPYGSTTYQAVRSQTETPKRYRYTGKERDEESGLYYHGARYYGPWLARWVSCDPAGIVDGTDVYAYARCNPLRYYDPNGYAVDGPDDPKVLALGLSRTAEGIRGLKGIRGVAEQSLPGRNVIDITEMPSWNQSWEENFGSAAPGGARDVMRFGKETAQKWAKFGGLGSAVVVQEALERGPDIHFDVRGVDALRSGQTAAELRSVIRALAIGANTESNIYILGEEGLSTIQKGTAVVQGANLPEAIAEHLPPSFRAATGPSQTFAQKVASTGRAIGSLIPGYDEVVLAGGGSFTAGASFLGTTYLPYQAGVAARHTIGFGRLALSSAESALASLSAEVSAGPIATAGVTAGSVVAAVGSVALAGEGIYSAIKGEKTMLEHADKFYGTGFSDIYGWSKRSVVGKVVAGPLSLIW